jgi:hypothetical protein
MALHFGGKCSCWTKATWQPEAKPVEECFLGFVGTHNAANAELPPVLHGQHHVHALNPAELFKDGPWA